jgi:hypothetical protein
VNFGKETIGVQEEYVTRVKHIMLHRASSGIPMGILQVTPQIIIITHTPAAYFASHILGYNKERYRLFN